MPRFAANLHYLFTEVPFMERVDAAAAAGFKAVEFQVPYDYPAAGLLLRVPASAFHQPGECGHPACHEVEGVSRWLPSDCESGERRSTPAEFE